MQKNHLLPFIYVQGVYENLHAIVDTAFLLQNEILSIYLFIYYLGDIDLLDDKLLSISLPLH